jgi:hypothetical protein
VGGGWQWRLRALARARGRGLWAVAVLPLVALSLTACHERPLRVVAVGDIHGPGTQPNAVATKNLASAFGPDLILGLGDYQYSSGTPSEFANGFDKDWGALVHKLYPVLAPNHDQYWRSAYPMLYFNGGGPSGYKAPVTLKALTPYSFDNHNWHFIALPDACFRVSRSECDPNAIAAWLHDDLTRSTKPCTIAYWHQPYFSSRSEGHDRYTETRFWVQVLVNHKVDLLLQGHQHGYERFGKQDADSRRSATGIRSVTVGTGGIGHYDWLDQDPNSKYQNDTEFGVLQMTLQTTSNNYAAQWVTVGGNVRDQFTGRCMGGT